MAARWLRAAAAFALLVRLGAASAEEGTCAAGGGAACRQPPSGSSGQPGFGAGAVPDTAAPASKADLITQEVEELEAFIKLSQERVELLKELKSAVKAGKSLPLPETHVETLRAKLPLLSEIAADSDKAPVAASEDYLVSKTVIPQDEPVSFIKFLPLRSPRTSSSSSTSSSQTSMPPALLVAVQESGSVRLFSPSGELVLAFSAGHDQVVTQVAVSPLQDDYLIATGDVGGVIRVHKVSVRQKRLSKEQKSARRNSTEEKLSQYLGNSMNVSAQLSNHMQVPADSDGEAPRMTALALASQQGSKYFVAGDAEGKVSIFTKNGTLRSRIDATTVPGVGIEGMSAQVSSLLFRAGSEWGYIDLEKHEARRIECPEFEGNVVAAIIDGTQASRVLIADQEGDLWVFNVKNKRECKVEFKYAKGSTKAPLDIASIKGFALGLERGRSPGEPASVVALNMSQVGKLKRSDAQSSQVVWRRNMHAVRDWAVHKRAPQGDLMAFLSEDGREIEVAELLMQAQAAPVQSDSFGNFKLPVIAVAVLLVLGYQYIKQKGKFSGGGGGGKGGKMADFSKEDFAAALRSKRAGAGAGLGGLGRPKGIGRKM